MAISVMARISAAITYAVAGYQKSGHLATLGEELDQHAVV